MYFTQEDYKKIESWLLRNSVKDSEFQEALPLTGDESVVITQDNHNRNLKIKDFVDEIIKVGIADFLNITERYKSPNITLKEAIALVPDLLRKKGQVITFSNPDGNWEIYQFTGALNQWNNVTLWEDVFNIDKFIINSILPDEEDLTKSEPDENGNSYLSLKDREYNPTEFSGLGRVILRKNLVEFEDGKGGKVIKNYLSQKDFSKENTIYEIRYAYDMQNSTIALPKGSVLKFNGGILKNATLRGNHNAIDAGNHTIFENVKLEGEFANSNMSVEWWGAKGDGETDDSVAINAAVQSIPLTKILNFTSAQYFINDTILVDRFIHIHCEGKILSNNCAPAFLIHGITFPTIYIENITNTNPIFQFSNSANWRYNAALVLYNCGHCDVQINSIWNFNSAVILVAEGGKVNNGGCAYNDITLGVLDTCFNGIRVMGIDGGWCNGNVVHRAKFQYHSWRKTDIIPYFIHIDSYGENKYSNNSLYFEDLMIEFGVKQTEYPRMIYANHLNGGFFHFTRIEVERGDETTSNYNGIYFGDNVYGSKVEIDFSWQLVNFNNKNANENRVFQSATYGVKSAKDIENVLDKIVYPSSVSVAFAEGYYDVRTGLVVYNAVLKTTDTITTILEGLPEPLAPMLVCVDNLEYGLWEKPPTGRTVCWFSGGTLSAQTPINYSTAIAINLVYYAN